MFSITTPSQGKYNDAIRAICPCKKMIKYMIYIDIYTGHLKIQNQRR